MKNILVSCLLLASACLLTTESDACTSVIVSGKVTPDGRPLMWKQRDTGALQNSVKYFSGEKYPFVAVVNSGDENPTDVWIGTNSAGFSVMNTQSFNLVDGVADDDRGEANGRVMRRALEICANVDDFKHFLDTITKPSLIEANFGVIDAQGGAAYFEVDYYKYTIFDANDPKDAPCGYISRTNFSFTGKVNRGLGYVRYMEEERKLMPASGMKKITPAWLLNELARSFNNPMLGVDLKKGEYNCPNGTGWFMESDLIPRSESASSVVIQGVKKGEKPELTTMWTALGYPPVSVVIPVWVKGADKQLPALVLTEKGTKASGMSKRTTVLLNKVYSYHQGSGSGRYFNWELLWNNDKTGYMQSLAPVEGKVFQMAEPKMKEWYERGEVDTKQVYQLYNELDQYISGEYGRLFGL